MHLSQPPINIDLSLILIFNEISIIEAFSDSYIYENSLFQFFHGADEPLVYPIYDDEECYSPDEGKFVY